MAPTITTQGRSLISAAITFFEEFLEDNVWFGSMEEVQTFIFNVLEEKPYRKYKDEDIIPGFKATVPMVLFKLLKNSGYLWVPTKEEGLVLWDQLSRLGQEDLNRIYLKNNLFEFCKSPVVIEKIVQALTKLQHPFLNPNKPPKEIKGDLEEIMDYFKEYVYYEYPVLDKMERVDKMPRDSVLIVDTDSCIISLEHWFQFVSKYTNGIDMRIKHMQLSVIDEIERDEFGDLRKFKVFEKVEKCYDYDMMTDELIERKRKISPLKIIPEDGLRSSIINIMSYILSQLILDYFEGISVRDHSWTPGWDCLLIMKNEFLMKAILLGFVKKHYCSNVLVKEGHLVRNPKKKLAITGFEFDKVNIPKSTSKALKEIMFEQILDRDEGIDQLQILNSLATLEKKIHESLLNGETKYYKPAKVKAMNAYEDPMRIQGIKGAFAYNQLKTSKERVIDLESPNSLIIIKTKIDKKTAEKVHQSNPDLYEKIMGVLEKSEYKNGISSIAIHYDDPIPEWIKPFINVQEILQDNLKSFPLESIGINKISNQYVTTSNIISI